MEAKHKAYLEELAAKVDAKLLEYVQVTPETRRQAQVVEAMRYSLEAGGKRIRPVLVLEFCRIFGGSEEQAMAAVLVIMLMTPGMAISVYLIPVWLIVLGIGYLFKEKTAKAVKAH